MRNMAIYQDKVFVATTDARLVALDARTGAKVWDTTIADRAKGYANTAGPMVMKGVVVNGLVGCDRYGNDGCWISGYDASTGKQLWKFNTVRRGDRAGRRHVGQARGQPAHRRRDLDRRQLRSGPRHHLLGRGAGEAVDAREPRIVELRQRPLYQLHGRAAVRRTARSRGTTSTRRVNRSTSTKCSSASWSISAIRRSCSRSASRASSGSSIAAPAQFLGYKETIFQNVFESIDPKNGTPTYRGDILEQQTGQWVDSCPSTEGGHNWQAMSYVPAGGRARSSR